jgi:hypothetical protein
VLLLVGVVTAIVLQFVVRIIANRPQTGILILAALAPFDGLLIIIPHPPLLAGWKEGLVLLTVGLAWWQRQRQAIAVSADFPSARYDDQRPVPTWVAPMIALLALALASALFHLGPPAIIGIKIGFFYLLVPLALWWAPLNAVERDRLITILMVVAGIVAVVGIGQQLAGPEALVAIGYEYNTHVRFASGILRSISTFNQPFAFAFYLMMVMLVGLPIALESPRRLRNTLFLVAMPLLIVAMVTAVVRAAIVGLIVGGLWLFVHRYRGLIHALIPAVIVALLLPASFTGAILSPSSMVQRADGWTQSVFEQGIEPFGQGIGSVGAALERVQDTRRSSEIEFPTQVDSQRYQPDNYYVKTLVELGPIGAWLLLAALVSAFLYTRRASLLPGARDGGLAAGIAASIVGACAAAFVSSYWEIFPADMYFWMLLGVVPSLFQESSSTPLPSPPVGVESKPTAEVS